MIILLFVIFIIIFMISLYYYNVYDTKQFYFDETFVITLPKHDEKYEYIKKKMEENNITLKKWNAVDTRNEKYKLYRNKINKKSLEKLEKTIKRKKRELHEDLTPGAVGCYLSHLSLYEYALKNNLNQIFILEDDTLFPENFLKELYKKIKKVPKDWDILLLNWIPYRYIPYNNKWKRIKKFYMMNAYIINKKGMEKILKLGIPIEKQIDSMLSDYSDQINIYGIDSFSFLKQRGNSTTIQIYDALEK